MNSKLTDISGETAAKITAQGADLVDVALPLGRVAEKITEPLLMCKKYYLFFNTRLKYFTDLLSTGTYKRDYGTHQENIKLSEHTKVLEFVKSQKSLYETKLADLKELMNTNTNENKEKVASMTLVSSFKEVLLGA